MSILLFGLLFVYLLSLVFSATFMMKEFQSGKDSGYKFSTKEEFLGILVPFVPILNTVWLYVVLKERS